MKVIVSLALGLTLVLPTAAHATTWRDNECRYQRLDGHMGWSTWEVKKTIRCATQKFSVDTSTALYIADRESHFRASATNSYSGACGIFQNIPSYWPGRLRNFATNRPKFKVLAGSCYDARSNVLASVWMMRSGFGPWS